MRQGHPRLSNNFQLFFFFASATVPALNLPLAVFSQWNKSGNCSPNQITIQFEFCFLICSNVPANKSKTVWILFSPSSYPQPPQLAHLVSVKHGCSLMCLGCHYTTVMCAIVKILREHSSWEMSSLDAWTIDHLQVSLPNPICGAGATFSNLPVCQWYPFLCKGCSVMCVVWFRMWWIAWQCMRSYHRF